MYENYLAHYGVLGMHWGQRTRNGIMKNQSTSSRQIDADQKGLVRLNNGEHAHYGINAKRQSKYDERDKKYLEGRIQATKSIQKALEARDNLRKASAALSFAASRDTSEIDAHAKQVEDLKKATIAYTEARIQAKRDRQATESGKARAERSGYIRAITKTGLPNSAADQQSGGMSTMLVKNLESRKGKEYADSVLQGVNNRLVGPVIAGLAVSGAIIVSSLLKDG